MLPSFNQVPLLRDHPRDRHIAAAVRLDPRGTTTSACEAEGAKALVGCWREGKAWRVLKVLNDPAVPLLGIYPSKRQTLCDPTRMWPQGSRSHRDRQWAVDEGEALLMGPECRFGKVRKFWGQSGEGGCTTV